MGPLKLHSQHVKDLDRLLKLPIHAYCKNRDYRYLRCSDLMAEHLNLEHPRKIIGLSDFETIIPKTSASDFLKQDKALFHDPSIKLFTDSATYKNNVTLDFITIKLPLFNQSGAVEAAFGLSIPLDKQNFGNQLIKFSKLLNLDLQALSIQDVISNINLSRGHEMALSKREKECLLLLVKGHSAASIANHYNLSKRTVEDYLNRAKNKLNCETKQQLIEFALNKFYVCLDE